MFEGFNVPTVGGGNPSGATTYSCSPVIRSGMRLVASTVSLGAPRSSSVTTSTTPASTCSQLSRISRIWRWRSQFSTSSRIGRSGDSGRPSTCAMVVAICSGSLIGDRSMNQIPCVYSWCRGSAARSAKRVLPLPPAPVSVMSRMPSWCRKVCRSRISRSRP